MVTTTSQQVGFKPTVGTALLKNGCVVTHERVIDSLGRFHGLIKLVIDGDGRIPDVDAWKQMMVKGAIVKAVLPDKTITSRTIILYKLEEQ